MTRYKLEELTKLKNFDDHDLTVIGEGVDISDQETESIEAGKKERMYEPFVVYYLVFGCMNYETLIDEKACYEFGEHLVDNMTGAPTCIYHEGNFYLWSDLRNLYEGGNN
jgi:hypothetical protein